jgi:hypothetical protein
MMVRVLLYAYCIGVFSSRKMMRRLQEDVAFRILSANNQPDFRTISEFRRRHLAALEGLFDQVLHLCMEAGLVKLGHVSIDGTKVMANASPHKAMSHGRMKKDLARLRAEARALLAEAERVDAEEDAEFGDRSGNEMPVEFADPKKRREIIDRALRAIKEAEQVPAGPAPAGQEGPQERPEGEPTEELERRTIRMERILVGERALEQRALQKAEAKDAGTTADPVDAATPGTVPKDVKRKNRKAKNTESEAGATEDRSSSPPVPDDKDQYNFTDPESRIMPSSSNKKAFIQGYNGQLVVDGANQIIVATGLTNSAADCPQLPAMMDRAEEACGKRPERMSGDTGYFSGKNLVYLERRGIDAYIPPDRQKHGEPRPKAPRGRIPKTLSREDRMRRKLRTKKGRKVYSRRKVIVEPPIGQIKQARGFRRFSMRGERKARGEWAIVGMTHNILRYHAVIGKVQ